MKKTLIVSSVLACVLTLGGCKSNNANSVAEVPPPSPSGPITAANDGSLTGPVALRGKTPPTYHEPAAGDAFTVGAPSPAAPLTPGGAGGNYVVRQGDTLWSISKSQYGTGQRWKDIAAANPGLTPEKMRVGMAIVLP